MSSLVENVERDALGSEHASTVQAFREAIRDTTKLTRLLAVLNEAGPLDSLLARVTSTLSELFLADIVVMLEATDDGDLVPLASIGLPVGIGHRSVSVAQGTHATAALQSSLPVVVAEAQADPQVDACLRELGAQTIVWLPAIGDEASRRGVLMLARCRALPFTQSDIELLKTMAYRVGLLVERVHADQARRQMEARLRQAEKTESLGRMAAAVAHHFNNTLAVVVASLDLALEEIPNGHGARDDIVRAREATMRAAKTGELMLAYIGQSATEREPIDLVRVTRTALRTLEAAFPRHLRSVFDLCTAPLIVATSPPQITQLLGNLVTNAVEAVGTRDGEIRVTLEAVAASAIPKSQLQSLEMDPTASSYACLEVSDNGCGMTRETIDKIFDPFYTTKFVGRGLGLPVVLGTVRAHGGFIAVESEPEQGTTVRVYLPLTSLATPSRDAVSPIAASTVSVERRALALVAEDEETLRRTTKRILNRMGFEVVTAADGIEAIDRFRDCADELRVVILDLAMPRMDGWATLDSIRAMRPDIPIILASGYDEAHALQGRPADPSLLFLHKPYTLSQLRTAVDRLTASGDRGTAKGEI